jgi:hypothetical protein
MIWTVLFRTVALLLLAIIVGLLLCLAFPGIRGGAGLTAASTPGAIAPVISPADVVTIVLAAATLVLGAVAIIISLLAFIGYEQMRRMVETKATAIASTRIEDYIRAKREEDVQARGLDEPAAFDEMAAALAGQPRSNGSKEGNG